MPRGSKSPTAPSGFVDQVPDETAPDLAAAKTEAAVASDEEYDIMMRRLEELERLFPELQSQDSPTQTVGGRADSTLFAPVVHAERMLSLDNVFSIEEF